MFFLAVCARGHVTNVARCVRRSVFRPIPASWRQQQQTGVCVRVELKLLQRLKNRISSVAHWCSYTQSHTHIPNLTTPEVRGHALKGPTESVTRSCHRRGHERTRSNDNRFKFYPTDPSFSSPSHLLLGLRLIPVGEVSVVENPGRPQPTAQLERTRGKPPSQLIDYLILYENPWTIPNLLCLDGYIARNWASQKSALGSALDPLADKILISVLYISLTYAQLIPALVIARDVGLIAAVFYVRYKTVPPPVTLNKFFNPCYTTAQLKPTTISKTVRSCKPYGEPPEYRSSKEDSGSPQS
ncbi:unnamed protein product [Coregonus sp. 'balchen']|nr:unnamed protein product [Coregonus sp. 'balchen']